MYYDQFTRLMKFARVQLCESNTVILELTQLASLPNTFHHRVSSYSATFTLSLIHSKHIKFFTQIIATLSYTGQGFLV